VCGERRGGCGGGRGRYLTHAGVEGDEENKEAKEDAYCGNKVKEHVDEADGGLAHAESRDVHDGTWAKHGTALPHLHALHHRRHVCDARVVRRNDVAQPVTAIHMDARDNSAAYIRGSPVDQVLALLERAALRQSKPWQARRGAAQRIAAALQHVTGFSFIIMRSNGTSCIVRFTPNAPSPARLVSHKTTRAFRL
jgi:hypothetical protein